MNLRYGFTKTVPSAYPVRGCSFSGDADIPLLPRAFDTLTEKSPYLALTRKILTQLGDYRAHKFAYQKADPYNSIH